MIRPIFTLILATLLFSCGSPCDDIDCGANGTCDETSESCICDDWYEGTNCEIETRAKFLDTWESSTACSFNGENDFTWVIAEGATPNAIILQSSNFFSDRIIEATLTDENNVTITPFVPGSGSDYTGQLRFINSSTLSLTLNIVTSTNNFDCSFTLTK